MDQPRICGYCHAPVDDGDAVVPCPACRTAYHAECWEENRGCAVYGCTEAPEAEPRKELEIPVSWWGREQKPCPSCGKEILAAAIRCRHCGATFTSARPEEAAAFNRRTALESRLPALRRKVWWMFVLSVLPCTAPAGVVMGLVWYRNAREEVAALPALYSALARLALGVSSAQTTAFVLVAVCYSLVRT